MFLKKRRNAAKKARIYAQLAAAVSDSGAEIVDFSYTPEMFGNISLTVEYGGERFVFDTDRGEIYCNHELICHNAYHVAGKSDTLDALSRVIREKLGLKESDKNA